MAVLSKPVSNPQRLVHLDYGPMMELDELTYAVIAKANDLLHCRLRDWQSRGLRSLLEKRDLFVKAGTGSGKSKVFQSMIAAKDKGIVLVLSPLKSLMDDQVPIILSSSD
jgi:superfamily II DNA helicase RecQ